MATESYCCCWCPANERSPKYISPALLLAIEQPIAAAAGGLLGVGLLL
jgi:hypothetical protein